METSLMGSLLLCLLTVLLLRALRFISRKTHATSPSNLPPGPSPLPIIGNLLLLGNKPHQSLAKLAQIHGPMITLKLGRITTIVISSSTIAKEALQTHDLILCNRPIIDAIQAHNHHKYSFAFLPVSQQWKNLRKICSSHIFSTQKLDSNEHLREKKIKQLVSNVQESCRVGEAIDIGQEAFITTLNALSSTVLSIDLSDTSFDMWGFKEAVKSIMEDVGKPNLVDFFPFLRKVDPQGIRRRMEVHFGKVLDLFGRVIEERVELMKGQGYVPKNDMLDTLLTISGRNCGEMDTSQMKRLFLDLFVAGTDTTSITLEWAMAEILRTPIILSKARAELEKNVGRGNFVNEMDILRLPYLQAIIKETFRLHPPVPLLLPRMSRGDVEISGFTIPKHAQVLVNVWAFGREPNIWKEPLLFSPERFLASNNNIDVKGNNFELIPFGAGRRICPGLPLAMRMLPLMLGNLLLFFDWKLADGVSPESMDMEEKFGITLQKANPLRAIPMQV